MLSAFTNCLKIPELRQRIFFVLGMIFIARLGANLPLPGVDPGPLQDYYSSLASRSGGTIVGLFNMFTGGALLKGAVFGLGIMPYISASIIMQLMGAVSPALARLQQEGEIGRQKITQYTRYLTILIAVIQALLLTLTMVRNPGGLFTGFDPKVYGAIIIISPVWFIITSTILLTAGTVILMWIGEQITQRGIGNGISLLITIGILADLPSAVAMAWQMFNAPAGTEGGLELHQLILMLVLLVLVIAGIILVVQGTRKIPVQYAKRVVGRKVFGGQSSFLPLKVNYAGVMPVIFGSAILMFPAQVLSMLGGATGYTFLERMAYAIAPGSVPYYVLFGFMIFVFSYFWVSIMFKPIQIAEDLKKSGGYIPGVRPGEPTSRFLDFVMTRLTFAGAIFLVVIALFPDFLNRAYNVPYQIALFFGGTGALIAVGVTLDTMRQVETYLLQRHYDGFLKKGRIRGRSATRTRQLVDTSELKNLKAMWLPLGILFAIGIGAWLYRAFVLN
jgi:preprotein translocase subunit SecY